MKAVDLKLHERIAAMEAADAARSPEAQRACDAACRCVDVDDYEGARAHLALLDPDDIEVVRIRKLIAFMEAP